MSQEPVSTFELKRIGLEVVSKSSSSLANLQKPLKKIYTSHFPHNSPETNLPFVKVYTSKQGLTITTLPQLGIDQGPPVTECFIAENQIVLKAALKFSSFNTAKKGTKFKAAFIPIETEAKQKQSKEVSNLFLSLDEKESYLPHLTHPSLFILLSKTNSNKQLELRVFKCTLEEQALNIVRSLKGEIVLSSQLSPEEKLLEVPGNLSIPQRTGSITSQTDVQSEETGISSVQTQEIQAPQGPPLNQKHQSFYSLNQEAQPSLQQNQSQQTNNQSTQLNNFQQLQQFQSQQEPNQLHTSQPEVQTQTFPFFSSSAGYPFSSETPQQQSSQPRDSSTSNFPPDYSDSPDFLVKFPRPSIDSTQTQQSSYPPIPNFSPPPPQLSCITSKNPFDPQGNFFNPPENIYNKQQQQHQPQIQQQMPQPQQPQNPQRPESIVSIHDNKPTHQTPFPQQGASFQQLQRTQFSLQQSNPQNQNQLQQLHSPNQINQNHFQQPPFQPQYDEFQQAQPSPFPQQPPQGSLPNNPPIPSSQPFSHDPQNSNVELASQSNSPPILTENKTNKPMKPEEPPPPRAPEPQRPPPKKPVPPKPVKPHNPNPISSNLDENLKNGVESLHLVKPKKYLGIPVLPFPVNIRKQEVPPEEKQEN